MPPSGSPHGRTFLLALLLALAGPAAPAADVQPLDPSVAPPPLALPDAAGVPGSLSEHRGRVVLLNFWGSWCPPCVEELPSIQRLADREKGRPFAVVTVNTGDSHHQVGDLSARLGLALPVLFDREGTAAAAWRVRVFPTTYLIDRQGRLRTRVLGPMEWDQDEAARLIEPLIAEAGPDGR
jgi:thiol-disulfide isomerase/thioredoxin